MIFKALGLEFEAEITGTKFVPARIFGHPDNRTPEEGGEIEFISLTCDGKDASFLFKNDLFRETLEIEATLQTLRDNDEYI